MRMLRILAPELGEKLSELQLQICRQRRRERVRFLELNTGLSVRLNFEDNVAESLEVGIDGTVQRDLGIGNGESVDLRIVVTALDGTDVLGSRQPGIRQCHEA